MSGDECKCVGIKDVLVELGITLTEDVLESGGEVCVCPDNDSYKKAADFKFDRDVGRQVWREATQVDWTRLEKDLRAQNREMIENPAGVAMGMAGMGVGMSGALKVFVVLTVVCPYTILVVAADQIFFPEGFFGQNYIIDRWMGPYEIVPHEELTIEYTDSAGNKNFLDCTEDHFKITPLGGNNCQIEYIDKYTHDKDHEIAMKREGEDNGEIGPSSRVIHQMKKLDCSGFTGFMVHKHMPRYFAD